MLTSGDLRFIGSRGWSVLGFSLADNYAGLVLERRGHTAAGFAELKQYFEHCWPRPCSCGASIEHHRHWRGHLNPRLAGTHELLVPEKLLNRFRCFQMVVNKQTKWLPLHGAAAAYDSGWMSVHFGSTVREFDGTERPMTQQDKVRVSDYAEEISASK